MEDIIWWIGAVHMTAYGIGGCLFVTWWAIERALRFFKLNSIILRWFFDKEKAKADAKRVPG